MKTNWTSSPTVDGFYWYWGAQAKQPVIVEVMGRGEERYVATFYSGHWQISHFLRKFPGRWQRVVPPAPPMSDA